MTDNIKRQVYQRCMTSVEERITAMESQLVLIRESRDNETKSSVGDKYETGRVMMQMEESKVMGQLQQVMNVRLTLRSIDPGVESQTAQLGSLVRTDQGIFFMSIGAGKVTVDGGVVYCVSMESPIGALLNGSQTGDTVQFRERAYKVIEVK